ncbi:MAG: VWA domain-containing protein [Oligoflexales bacterium]
MNFANINYLILLWLIPICAALIYLGQKRRKKRLQAFAALRLPELLTVSENRFTSTIKACLLLLAVAAIVTGLARPRWGFEWREVPQGGIDIMVVLDLSTSMLATDIPPNRLERAKRELIDLLGMLDGDRFGIVAFAGVPFVQCPLTVDYRLASLFINQLSLDLIPVQGTALGDAIELGVDSLVKASSAESQGKAIILITDGEDQNQNTLKAAQKAKEKAVKIYAIGIGKEEGSPIPLPTGGYKKDHNGNVIISKLDEKTLQEAALISGGTYVRSTTGDIDLDQIYTKGIKVSLEAGAYGESRQKIWYERFQWFLSLALGFLFVEFLLKEFRQKRELSQNDQ